MESASFSLDEHDLSQRSADLGAALIGVSGVGSVSFDRDTRTVSITYDPNYLSKASLAAYVKGAGYDSEEAASP